MRALFVVLSLCMMPLACRGQQGRVSELVVSSDLDLARMAAEVLPDVAKRAGLPQIEPVRVERRTRAELEAYLIQALDEEVLNEEVEYLEESYALLGLLPEGTDLREIFMSLMLEQIVGFYEPDSTALFVLDDQPEALLRPVLIHELVHALQDQHANLDSLTATDRGNDRQVAAQSAIEGHATLVMLEFMTEEMAGQPTDLANFPDFSETMGPLIEMASAQSPELARAPKLLQAALIRPYVDGASFVQALWRLREGRPAPFGDLLPQSTEQVLSPADFLGDDRDDPVELELEVEEGAAVLYTNTLGALELSVFLEELTGEAHASLVESWGGDRFALIDGAGAGPRELVWVSVWDTETARDRFFSTLEGSIDRLPEKAATSVLDVDGHPGVILRVRSALAVTARISGAGVPGGAIP